MLYIWVMVVTWWLQHEAPQHLPPPSPPSEPAPGDETQLGQGRQCDGARGSAQPGALVGLVRPTALSSLGPDGGILLGGHPGWPSRFNKGDQEEDDDDLCWYFLSTWEGGGYRTSSPNCQTWRESVWAKCTAPTLSTRRYIVRRTFSHQCKNITLSLSLGLNSTESDKLSSKVAFYRGNQPRFESGLISFDDIKDSNLLKYTEEKAGKVWDMLDTVFGG